MSESASKAVFLSYASQDAPAVERIAEALRAAGVEVWFDKNELTGGDAWDQKIRRQIKDCALLIPVISAATQARTEGYFRLEWRLADQRTHLMAKGRPFLLPVVIDDTRDAEAHVPDSFTEVQWTRLPGGEASGAFAARVKQLLGSAEREAGRPRPAERIEVTAPPKQSFRPWLVAVIIVAAILAGVWQQQRSHAPVPVLPAAKSGSRPEVAQILDRVRGLTGKTDVLRTELDTASDLLGQAVKLDSADAAVWAEWALVDCRYVDEYYDQSAARLDAARRHAAQATGLNPKAPHVRFVQARVMLRLAYNPPTRVAAEKILRPLLTEVPDQGPVLLELGWLAFERAQPEAALEWFDRAVLVPGYAGRAHFAKALAFHYSGLLAKAQEELDRALQSEQAAKFLLWKAHLLSIWEGDTAGASRMLDRVPAGVFVEDMPATTRYGVAMLARDYDQALASIRAVPHDYLQSRADTGPSGYFTGCALALAGKPAAAELEWRSGLAVVERRLATEPNSWNLMTYKVLLQVALGDRSAALPTWKALQELYGQYAEENPDLQMQMLPPEEALTWVAGRITRGSILVTAARLRLDPSYAPIRSLPGFAALLARAEADPRLSPHAKGASPEKSAVTSKADDKSVAVLAFANLSDDKNNEYFSDGISEELLNVLAKVPGLKVSARTSAFYFKGREVPIPDIAKQLGVAYVVEGSVRKQGDKVRITAQLIKAADGFHVWSDTFTRDLKDIFAVQDEIAGLIAQNLQLKLGMKSAPRVVNPEAYALFLQGRAIINRGVPDDYAKGIQCFKDSLALDGGSALTWAWLATSYGTAAAQNTMPAAPTYALAREAVNRALALDPELGEGHFALGSLQFLADWDWARADESLQHALLLAPGDASTLSQASNLAAALGQWERAVQLGRQAVALDPLNYFPAFVLGKAYFRTGRYAEMEKLAEQMIAVNPAGRFGPVFLAFARLLQGRVATAAQTAEQMEPSVFQLMCLALARHAQGRGAESDAALNELKARNSEGRGYLIAEVYAYRGERDRAFEWLEQCHREHDSGLTWLVGDPFMQSLRGDARWAALLKKMNLPNSPAQ